MIPDLSTAIGFQWDHGNAEKNWTKHGVRSVEAEEIFFNQPLLLEEDVEHSHHERRFWALGRTNADRLLFVVLMIRKNFIRIISVRDMSRKERATYEKA